MLDKNILKQAVTITHNQYPWLAESIIEKDYYVYLVLRRISALMDNAVVFKGGTSLSKAYNLIMRFSEDIDLCLPQDKRTDSYKKRLVASTLEALSDCGLVFSETKSNQIERRGIYNCIVGTYNPVTTDSAVEPYIKVEISHRVQEFPYAVCNIGSYVASACGVQLGSVLPTFSVQTVAVQRTFVDKLFAIGDYYYDNKCKRYSRHLYDLYKLIAVFNWNDASVVQQFYIFFDQVKEARVKSEKCRTAQPGVDTRVMIYNSVVSDFFKEDYYNLTQYLLYESVTYEMCKERILWFLNTYPIVH